MKNDLFKKVEKGLIISIILSITIYTLLFFLSDFNEIINAVNRIGIILILVLLLLSSLNYLMRFSRWQLLIKNARVKINFINSLKSFLAGLCLTITPGKSGELLKASFVKKYSKTSKLKIIPIIVLERVFDLTGFASILLFSLLFASFESYQSLAVNSVIIVFLTITVLFLFLRTRLFKKLVKKLIKKFEILKKREKVILEVLEDYSTITPYKIITLIILSFLGWFFEVVELYLLFQIFNINTGLFTAGFIHGFSSLIGLISLTPGGIIGFEASSELLLQKFTGASISVATLITLIIRLTTLWFAVLVGLITYLKCIKK